MSELERTVRDLVTARLALTKVVTLPKPSQARSNPALKLCEKWRGLEASLGRAHKFLGSRAKELAMRERVVRATEETLRNRQKEVDSKNDTLLSCEKSLSKRIKQVWLRQEEVKKWIAIIALDKKRINEREKQLDDRFRAVEGREKEVKERLDEIKKDNTGNNKNVETLKNQLKQRLEKVKEEKIETSEESDIDGQVDDDMVSKTDSNEEDEVLDEEHQRHHKAVVTTKLALKNKEQPLSERYTLVLEEFEKAMEEMNKNVKNSKRKLNQLETEKGIQGRKVEHRELDNNVVSKTRSGDENEASENKRKRRKMMVTTQD